MIALGWGAGCADESGEAAPSGAADGTTAAASTAAEVSSTTDDWPFDSTGAEPPPPVVCDEPPSQTTVDGLVHRGRAEGDTFIEILDLQSRGDLVYSCTATQGVTIWDAREDAPPLVVQNVGPPGLAHPQFPRCQHIALDASTDRAVITNRGDEVQPTPWLYLYDLSDPSQPVALKGWSGDASIEGVVLDGNRIYAAAHTSGVLVFEDQGDALVQVGAFADDASDAWKPLLVGDTLYVAEGSTGLRVYDVSGDDPVLQATLALPGSSKDLELDGDTLFIAASSALAAVDVSDPSAPEVVGERETLGTAVALALGEDGLLYTAEWDELRAYDRSQPDMPRVWSEVVPTGDPISRVLTVAADPARPRIYAGEWTGMQVFDAQPDPTGPDIVASPLAVQFGRVEPGDSEDRVFVIRNEGDQPLEVFGTASHKDAVQLRESCFTVEPGDAYAVEVRFTPDSQNISAGHIALMTNDPDEPEYRLRFVGNAAGADVGDPMVDFVLQDLEGNAWSREDLEGKVVLLAYFATF
ncbi:MAG: hypothetical protein AAGA54_30595 [Myxococcota bacterium]